MVPVLEGDGMMNIIKNSIRNLVRRSGFDIVRFPKKQLGVDPFIDMQHFLSGYEKPVIFDVGANVGQSVDRFKLTFPESSIYSFEPSPTTFEKLRTHCEKLMGVKIWNQGVGSCDTIQAFEENECSVMSSFLKPSEFCWGKVLKSTDVQVVTLDTFTRDHNIEFIHILKSDTQGYDFEVFKGASRLIMENKIGLIYFEFIFSDMYKNLPLFHDVLRYLSVHNFDLVTFYEPFFQKDLISWTDVLFISRHFNQRRNTDRT